MDNNYETTGDSGVTSNKETGWDGVAAMANETQDATANQEENQNTAESFKETTIGSQIEDYKQRGEICPAFVFEDGFQHASAAEKFVSLTEDKVGLHRGCRENAMHRAFNALSSGSPLTLDAIDMEKCLDTITNNGHPEEGLKIQDILDGKVEGDFNKAHLDVTIPVVEMLLKNRSLYEKQVEDYKRKMEQEYKAAVKQEIELSHEVTGVDLIKVMEKIGRYDYYDESDIKGEISFEVDAGKMSTSTYEDCSDEEKKLILAINRNVEDVWYEKSRNRGLGFNTETPSKTVEEWLEEAQKETIPSDKFLSEALDEVVWPDNYDLVSNEYWGYDEEDNDGDDAAELDEDGSADGVEDTDDAEAEKRYEKLYYAAFKERKHRR